MTSCLTCKSSKPVQFSKNERVIPMWMKKEGIYSLLPKILLESDNYNAFKSKFKTRIPDVTGIKVKIPLDLGKSKKNTWVFYWAAKEYDDLLKPSAVKPVKEVYKTYKNSGLKKTNVEGKITLELSCPQTYRVDGVSYPGHVHFTTLKSDKTWEEDIYTSDIICLLNNTQMNDVRNSKSHMIINSLDNENYSMEHIPNSYNLSITELNSMDKSKRNTKIDNFMRYHIKKYPKIYKLYCDEKITIKEIPIVVYCYSYACKSSNNLITLLLSMGFNNVIEYPGGILEWKKHYEVDSNPFSVKSKPKTLVASSSNKSPKNKSPKKKSPKNKSPKKKSPKKKSPKKKSHKKKSHKKKSHKSKNIDKLNNISDYIIIKKKNKKQPDVNEAVIFGFGLG
jgi:rhodanese-related sulfurtransferase